MGIVHFLNVGNGDCSVILHPLGRTTVIDVSCATEEEGTVKKAALGEGLPGNYNQKATPENPIAYLRKLGVKSIFRFILTHPDMDHMDGIKDLFAAFSPANFWDTDNNCEKEEWEAGRYNQEDWLFYKYLRDSNPQQNPKRLTLHSGQRGAHYNLPDGDADGLYLLAPTRDLVNLANETGDYNHVSYVILYKAGKTRIVFGGDSHDATWEHILKNHGDDVKDVDLLVAPHHGRHSDRSFEFLDVLKPKLTLFGNASSDHLAYEPWNARDLTFITNNQAGNVIVDTSVHPANVYVSNEVFAAKVNPTGLYSAQHLGYFVGTLT